MSLSTETHKNSQECEYKSNLKMLRQIDLFARLPIESLKVFAYLCERETFQPGDVLFSQGEDNGQAYYIIEGSARLVDLEKDPDASLRTYEAGTFLGRLTLIGQTNRLYTLIARTQMHCLLLSREKFSQALDPFPQLYPLIMQVVATKIANWEKQNLRRGQDGQTAMPVGVSML
ncbi:cyclic nucleotide-binding domain-containing protein [Desulfosarcina ovata]|uniref:Cyclic nucleotide-binding domain-containing protein n=2 Tax=Desulfosarcina ovata TaxID=83564 RepID=A0A5K8ALF4_9BACT|nr:cyclic nucleotide-binding domain-containing protein [Desulfosarcina ovata]BBO86612.1 hypothetical protein DSCO28_71780 [Desulfosarcina ovata subsp. sediminis]BBO93468.1 hypothetical protein DSCOOX_66480 [Desulfosarcina ovata subsp. ovata]